MQVLGRLVDMWEMIRDRMPRVERMKEVPNLTIDESKPMQKVISDTRHKFVVDGDNFKIV